MAFIRTVLETAIHVKRNAQQMRSVEELNVEVRLITAVGGGMGSVNTIQKESTATVSVDVSRARPIDADDVACVATRTSASCDHRSSRFTSRTTG